MTSSDKSVHDQISALVGREHELRSQLRTDDDDVRDTSRAALAHVEEMLDQCWDLLRQRQARRDSGQNPDHAAARPTEQVEQYLQ